MVVGAAAARNSLESAAALSSSTDSVQGIARRAKRGASPHSLVGDAAPPRPMSCTAPVAHAPTVASSKKGERENGKEGEKIGVGRMEKENGSVQSLWGPYTCAPTTRQPLQLLRTVRFR